MRILTLSLVFLITILPHAFGETSEPFEITRYEAEYSTAHIQPGLLNGKPGLAVIFKGTDDLHYYANPESAPAPGFHLQVTAQADKDFSFKDTVYPTHTFYYDKALSKEVEVYVGNFTVFIPFNTYDKTATSTSATVTIKGMACTSKLCLAPFTHTLPVTLNPSQINTWAAIEIKTDTDISGTTVDSLGSTNYSWPFALGLALLAGLMLNVMPCVWPVIPIIITRIWNQAGKNRAKSMSFGIVFCFGILLFFAAIAILNIVLNIGFGTVLQWGDLLRNQGFLIFMTLLMIVLGLFMFGVFSFGIPSSVTAKAGGGSGYAGMLGMGFLAALLATPCSFGVLAAAVAWAQTQNLAIATLVLMIIGIGMAIPYLILTSIPGLLGRLPKPGGWMEKVKIIMGFLLLVIAVKMLSAIPGNMKNTVLYYSLILSFSVWMWGSWVTFSTPSGKKWFIRSTALILAVVSGMLMLGEKKQYIDWQPYDADFITETLKQDKPVLIKFTADWCTNCTLVKKRVFEKTNTGQLLKQKGVVSILADTTLSDYPATIDLSQRYKEPGVPVSILLTPDGNIEKLRGVISQDDLFNVLNQLPDINP